MKLLNKWLPNLNIKWSHVYKPSKWSLKTKLVLSALVSSVMIIAVGMVSHFSQNEIIKSYESMLKKEVMIVNIFNEMNINYKEVVITITMITHKGKRPEVVNELNTKYDNSVDAFNNSKTAVKRLLEDIKQDGDLEIINGTWKALNGINDELMSLSFSDAEEDQKKTQEILHGKFYSARKNFSASITELINKQVKSMDKIQDNIRARTKQLNMISWTTVIAGFLLSSIMAWIFSLFLSLKLSNISEAMSQGAGSVTQTSQLLSSISEKLSSASTEQASAMQQTAATTDHLSTTIKMNAENSKTSQELAKEARHQAENGQQLAITLVTKMSEIQNSNKEISEQINNSNKEMSNIVSVIKQIASKTTVINDIVFQTRLLSFNALVEAARAGEHGKGFAVVAEEVGKLASMSGEASKEISGMLSQSTSTVENLINQSKMKIHNLMFTGGKKIEEGVISVEKTAEALQKITQYIIDVDTKMAEITAATVEESQRIQEINKAVEQLEILAQGNLKIVSDSAESSFVLSGNASHLKQLSETLLETVYGFVNNECINQSSDNSDVEFISETKPPSRAA